MNIEEYATYDGIGLAKLVSQGEVTPLELAELAEQAIRQVNPEVNAVVEVYTDRIERFDATSVEKGPFFGVPFLIKDGETPEAGRKVEFGSRLCEGLIAEQDSNLLQLFRSAGLNIIGRSNTPEFSRSVTTENSLYGNTSTPWRHGYSAGGSTGGGMAAVVSGMVPLAQGSDLGGSIRVPASWCGGVGLKPSRGRVSAGPLQAELVEGFAVQFAQTKSIRDCAAMLDCMATPMPGDPFVIPKPEISYSKGIESKQPPLKIGYTTASLIDNSTVDNEVASAVRATASLLAELGHDVFELPLALKWDEIAQAMNIYLNYKMDFITDYLAVRSGRQIGPQTLDPITLQVYEASKKIDKTAYFRASAYFNTERRRLGQLLAGCDIWLTPTTSHVSPAHGGCYNLGLADITPLDWLMDMGEAAQFTFPHNIMGTPAISLPLAMHSSGFPMGVQLGAGPAREHLLLGLSAILEKEMPWSNRRPPLHASQTPPRK